MSEAWEFLVGDQIGLYLSNGDYRSGTLEKFWIGYDGRMLTITIHDEAKDETIVINGDHVLGYVTGPPK